MSTTIAGLFGIQAELSPVGRADYVFDCVVVRQATTRAIAFKSGLSG